MNVLSLCGPESGIPKNPSVRLLSYSKASDKVSVNSLLRVLLFLTILSFIIVFFESFFYGHTFFSFII